MSVAQPREGMENFSEMLRDMLPRRSKKRTVKVTEARRILLEQVPVEGPNPSVGFMLQKDLLLPWRSIVRNVEFGLEARSISRTSQALANSSLERSRRASGPRIGVMRRRSLEGPGVAGGFNRSYPRKRSSSCAFA